MKRERVFFREMERRSNYAGGKEDGAVKVKDHRKVTLLRHIKYMR